jgi:hypothetical protein
MAFSICYIENISGEVKRLNGKEFQDDEIYQIPDSEREKWINDAVIDEIEAENFQIHDIEGAIEDIGCQVFHLKDEYNFSCAIDKDGTDQSLSGNDWIEITGSRILWDLGENYDIENNNFVIPFNGIYVFDIQAKIDSISNCSRIELAVFKRQEPADDYWFILDNKNIINETSVQLTSMTLFDFYFSEEYCLKIKLYGEGASASIDGDDDFTAWGYNFIRRIYLYGDEC